MIINDNGYSKTPCLAPIVLFVYNRPWHTRQTVETLQRNLLASESELFVFSDGPKKPEDKEKIDEVREYIRSITGFGAIRLIERRHNLGLANSVINGVTEVIETYGRVIVMEDDILTVPNFLLFMNKALDTYREYDLIGSVTGYSLPIQIPTDYFFPVYLTHRHSSWGWGTWQRVWSKIDWEISDYDRFQSDRRAKQDFNAAGADMVAMLDMQMKGKLDSWSIRFDYACFRSGALSLAPVSNLVKNIGFDGSGMHCGPSGKHLQGMLTSDEETFNFPENPTLDSSIADATRKLFSCSLTARLKLFLKLLQKPFQGYT